MFKDQYLKKYVNNKSYSYFQVSLYCNGECLPFLMIQVLDATDNEPWGPHGSALAEIAQATKKL